MSPVNISSHQKQLEFEDNQFLSSLFGYHDKNLKVLENKFKVKLYTRGNLLSIKGNRDPVEKAYFIIQGLYQKLKNNDISAEEIENSVLVHEFGHLLGLVNLVYKSPVDHEDKDHPGHSNNEDSVMYWAIESANLGNIITGELPDEFDNDDLNDLSGMLSGEIPVTNQIWLP